MALSSQRRTTPLRTAEGGSNWANPTHLVCHRTVHAFQFPRIPGGEVHSRGLRGDERCLRRLSVVLWFSNRLFAELGDHLRSPPRDVCGTYRTRHHISQNGSKQLSTFPGQCISKLSKFDGWGNRLKTGGSMVRVPGAQRR